MKNIFVFTTPFKISVKLIWYIALGWTSSTCCLPTDTHNLKPVSFAIYIDSYKVCIWKGE